MSSFILIMLFCLALFLIIPFLIFYIMGMWKLFKKMGKEGWESIIPFYNYYVLCQVSGLDYYWFILVMAPLILSMLSRISSIFSTLSFFGTIANILANVAIAYNLKEIFKKDESWLILSVFFGYVMYPLLGYSNIQPDLNAQISKDSFFKQK